MKRLAALQMGARKKAQSKQRGAARDFKSWDCGDIEVSQPASQPRGDIHEPSEDCATTGSTPGHSEQPRNPPSDSASRVEAEPVRRGPVDAVATEKSCWAVEGIDWIMVEDQDSDDEF